MEDINEVIRREYEKGTPLQVICKLVGRHKSRVMNRAKQMGLIHPNRDNAIITSGSSLKGDTEMNTPRPATQADLNALKAHCEAHGLPFDARRLWWHKTTEFSVSFYDAEKLIEEQNHYQTLLDDIKKHAPKYKATAIPPSGDNLMVLPMADIHVGKWLSKEETSSEYNSKIVEERVCSGTDALVSKAKAFGVSEFVVCLGNDMLHTDDGRATTSGTPQDNDGSWFSNFRLAVKIMTGIIEQLALHGKVHLMFVPANHDWRSGFAVAQVVAAHFANHPNVSNGTNGSGVTELHRKYFVYGHNLIMFTHGDGAKEKDLHWLMATEAAEAWSKTKFRYVYMGHIHHKVRKTQGITNALIEKDKIGYTEINAGSFVNPEHSVAIEYARSPTPSDGWHHRNGYINQQAVEAFLHHPIGGQVARFTHFF